MSLEEILAHLEQLRQETGRALQGQAVLASGPPAEGAGLAGGGGADVSRGRTREEKRQVGGAEGGASCMSYRTFSR